MLGLLSPSVLQAASGSPAMAGLLGPLTQQEPQKGFLGRIGDRFFGDEASPEQRRGLLGQALMSMGAGMAQTGGQGTMGALGNGIQSGLLSLNQGADTLREQQYRQQRLTRELGDPAGLREFNALTEGLSPEDVQRARRVRLGLDGRASSAGMGFGEITDANGIPRPTRHNPRSGEFEVFYDEQGRWVPLGGAGLLDGAQPSMPQSGLLSQNAPLPQGSSQSIIEQIAASANQMIAAGMPEDQVEAWAAQQMGGGQVSDGIRPQPAPAGLGRGRRPEDHVAATAAAQRSVELSYLPQELRMRTEAAVDQSGRSTHAEGVSREGVDYLTKINGRADMAATENSRLDQLEYALGRTYSGFGAEQLVTLRQLAGAFGIGDADSLGAAELARSISNRMALGLRNPAGGEGMPGNMSNDDRAFLQRTVPSLQNSEGGWRQMIEISRRLNDYAIRQSEEANRYLQSGGQASGLRSHMQQWANQNPLFVAPQQSERPARRTLQGEISGVAADAQQAIRAPRATNPQTGEVLELRNGQWVPAR